MEAFSPATWYEIPGRGMVAVIASVTEYDPTTLVGTRVTLGGAPFLVTGVETPAIDNPSGYVFGLLVEPMEAA